VAARLRGSERGGDLAFGGALRDDERVVIECAGAGGRVDHDRFERCLRGHLRVEEALARVGALATVAGHQRQPACGGFGVRE
jgi:hypothetical protein